MARRSKGIPSLRFPKAEPPPRCVTATIDGAARGNPGPAAYGVVFEDSGGKVLAELSSRLGKATNNVAEYRALLAALAYARAQGCRALRVRTDSELLARQLQGDYRVRAPELKLLHAEAHQLIAALDYFAVEAVSRKLTRRADKLANAALDRRPPPAPFGLRRRRPVPGAQRRVKKSFSPAAPAAGRRVRAVYAGGVLKPLEKLDLADGTEVEITLRRKP